MNVTKIPAGATHIKVTDKSRNYLGRTCPVSIPVTPSWSCLVPPVGAGRAGGGCAVPCHAVPVPRSDAVLSIAGSVNSPALGALFQRPWPWVLGRAELEWGQDSHQGTRIGTLVPRPPSPSRCSWGPGPRHNQGLGAWGVFTPGFGSGLGPKPSSYKKADFSRAPATALPAHAALPAPGEASGGDPGIRAAPSPAWHGVPGPVRCSIPGHAPSRSPDDE